MYVSKSGFTRLLGKVFMPLKQGFYPLRQICGFSTLMSTSKCLQVALLGQLWICIESTCYFCIHVNVLVMISSVATLKHVSVLEDKGVCQKIYS